MLINWFTVFAQAINFLILVWLLSRFLYKPVLHAIDERGKGIADQLADAEAKDTEAKKERDDFQRKNDDFDKERAGLLKKATDDADAERQRLLDAARKDADALRAKRRDALRKPNRRTSNQDLIRWTRDQVFDIARNHVGGPRRHGPRGSHRRHLRQVRVRALSGSAKDRMADRLQGIEPHCERA